MQDILYSDYITFSILGDKINIISDELEHGRNSVAEIYGRLYFLGNDYPNIMSAIKAWQKLNERDLTTEEIKQAMIDNHVASNAI